MINPETQKQSPKVQNENKKSGEIKILNYNYSDQGPYVVFIDMLKIPAKSNGLDDVKIGKLMKTKKLNEFIN